jgi:CheY-like chemotaxis protein
MAQELKRHFMIVENDLNDALLIQRAFKKISDCGTLSLCRNTSEARAYLQGAGMYLNREQFPFPDVIVSDFRMPGGTGVELVQWIREQPALADLPVVILTGSASPTEMEGAAAAGATHVLRKPLDLDNLIHMLQGVATSVLKTEAHRPEQA